MIPIRWNFHFPFFINDVTFVWVCTKQLSLELKGKVAESETFLGNECFDFWFWFDFPVYLKDEWENWTCSTEHHLAFPSTHSNFIVNTVVSRTCLFLAEDSLLAARERPESSSLKSKWRHVFGVGAEMKTEAFKARAYCLNTAQNKGCDASSLHSSSVTVLSGSYYKWLLRHCQQIAQVLS